MLKPLRILFIMKLYARVCTSIKIISVWYRYTIFYKQDFHKQRQAEIGTKSS